MGTMNKPLMDIDQPSLQAEVDSYVPGKGFAWRDLFPLRYTPKFDLKGIEGKEGIPISADRVAFNTKAPLKTRKTVGSWTGTLEKIAISREKDEIEINEYNDLKTIAAAADTDKAAKQHIVDLIYDDVEFCNDGMDAKVELDAMRIASHGVKTYNKEIDGENATEDIINFNVPAENFYGVGADTEKWSASTADGIGMIMKMVKAIQKSGKKKPAYCFMEQQAFDNLCAQEKTAKRLFTASALKNDMIFTAERVTLDNINNYLASKGMPRIAVLDTWVTVQDKNGKETTMKPWAENVVVLSLTAQLGWTWYKTVPQVQNTEALQAYGAFYKTTRYSELNPMLEVTMAEAYVQPALINRSSMMFLNTENTEWAGGEVAKA